MKRIYNIKNLFGICSCEGCSESADADITISGINSKTGKEEDIISSVCVKHANLIRKDMERDGEFKEIEII